MPRSVSGAYTLPAGNPVVTGTTISSGWANPTMADLATEITNSLDRNGRGGMLAALALIDGTASQPSLTFSSEPTTGFFRSGGSETSFATSGSTRATFNATGLGLGVTPSYRLDVLGVSQFRSTSAGTGNGTTSVQVLRAVNSTGSDWATAIASAWNYTWNGGSAGTTEFMRLSDSGNLGIGTNNPGARLHVNSAAGEGFRLSNTAGVEQIRLYTRHTAGLSRVEAQSSTLELGTSGNEAIHLFTNSVVRGRMSAAGNLGLGMGTSDTNALLHLGTTATTPVNVDFRIGYVTDAYGWRLRNESNAGSVAAGNLRLQRGNVSGWEDALILDNSGNTILSPPATPPTLSVNGQLTVNPTSNTNLRFSYRGSDGVIRVANITLS